MFKDAKDRLKWAREQAGYSSATAAAAAAGLPTPTYAHYESGNNGFSRHAHKFARLFRVNLEWLLTGKGSPNGDLLFTRDVVIKSDVAAGVYSENPEWPEDVWQKINIPYEPRFEKYELQGCRVVGDSMNLMFPEGTLLIWVSIFDTQEPLMDGKPYIVRRKSAAGEYETTCKIVRNIEGDWFLYPRSSNPKWKPLPAEGLEGDEIEVLGRVVRSYHLHD